VPSMTRVARRAGVALIGVVSASRGKVDYFVPGGEAGDHFSAVGIGVESVAAGTEGSYLSCLDELAVRIVEADLTMSGSGVS
jgi:hypothetical protein